MELRDEMSRRGASLEFDKTTGALIRATGDADTEFDDDEVDAIEPASAPA